LLLLGANLIDEVFVHNKEVMFRSIKGDKWYKTDVSMLSKDRLFKILNNKPNLIFDGSSD